MNCIRTAGITRLVHPFLSFCALFLALFILLPPSALAQRNPVRDASALTVMQNSITAMGGSLGWSAVEDWTISGAESVNNSPKGTFTWIGAGLEFCHTTQTANYTNQYLSGHGSPASIANGATSPLNVFISRASPPFYLPGVRLTQELANSGLTIQYIGSSITHGVPSIQIHVSDDTDTIGALVTPHDWFFDAVTLLPLQVQQRIPPNQNASDYVNSTLDFWQYQTVTGLSVPAQMSSAVDGDTTTSFSLDSVIFNSGVSPSTFDLPTGGGQ